MSRSSSKILTGLESVSDEALLTSARLSAQKERGTLEVMLRQLCEIERRVLYAQEGYKSLYQYCARELGLSEGESWRRTNVSRACIKYPRLFTVIGKGEIHLASLALITPHFTDDNWKDLLAKASRKSKREVERMVAPYLNRPERFDRVRFLGSTGTAGNEIKGPLAKDSGETSPPSQRVEIVFSADEVILKKLERVKDLLRSKMRSVKFEDAVVAGLDAWLQVNDPDVILRRKEARRRKVGPPSNKKRTPSRMRRQTRSDESLNSSRNIPQSVRDEVYKRDGGRCVFVSASGTRCDARSGLELDHLKPFALGGRSDDVENIRLLCATHNQLSARQWFGRDKIESIIAEKQSQRDLKNGKSRGSRNPRGP